MSDLKPCPFCGPKEETYQPYVDGSEGYYYVACGWCEIKISEEKSLDKAISVWNTRASPWIPCKDRLPEGYGEYLGSTRARPNGWVFLYPPIGWICSDDFPVTHWQPLPAPPDKDEA